MTVDWAAIGKTAFSSFVGAGLGSALIQSIFSAMSERKRRTARATYLAMRLEVLLNEFGLACSDMITRNANAETPPDEEYPIWEGLPELPPFPEDDEGWTALHRALAMRCLRFRSGIQSSETILRATAEYTEEDYGDTLDEQAARLGLEAWQIVKGLRRRYSLGKTGGEYAAQLEATLKNAVNAMTDRRRRQAEGLARMRREMSKRSDRTGTAGSGS